MKYFIYCRKSSEDKKRQVLSIQSQRAEAEKVFSSKEDIEIAGIFEEERSAMKLGRPIFAEMMRRIERGDAHGIIAWAPDRLARNSIDGGQIVYLLDCGILRDLKFSTYTFENNSQGKFMLQIMFGQSKYYSDALSENVKRGVRTKIENGWWPTIAPLGYRNDKETSTVIPDPERFSLVQQMLHMVLTGAYSAEQIWQASLAWGLLTPQRPRLGGKPLALSTVYKVFYNPFYAGIIEWNGKWHPGKHEPMISLTEHYRIKEILSRPGRPQAKRLYFAYAGLMRCGACGLAVTAEQKTNRWGSTYTYYHCTKRGRPRCTEPSVEVKQLEAQFRILLESLSITESLHAWASEALLQLQQETDNGSEEALQSLDRAIKATERRTLELAEMRSRKLLSDDEYLTMRESGEREMLRLRQDRSEREKNGNRWFEPAKAIILFSKRAVSWFDEGTDEEKRLILMAAGSNPVLKSKIVSLQANEFYLCIPKTRCFPSWRRFVESIRKMEDTSELDTVLSYIKKVEELRVARVSNAQPSQSVAHAKSEARYSSNNRPAPRLRPK